MENIKERVKIETNHQDAETYKKAIHKLIENVNEIKTLKFIYDLLSIR